MVIIKFLTHFATFGGTFDNEINAFSNYNNQIYIAGPRYADTVFISNIGRWVGGNYRDSCANDELTSITQLINNNQHFKIYPNPTSKTISLNMERINSYQNSIITIQNTLGQTISKLSFTNSVDVSDLQPGCYFIQATLPTGEIYKNKFIKQ
jgi:hypothetical protein